MLNQLSYIGAPRIFISPEHLTPCLNMQAAIMDHIFLRPTLYRNWEKWAKTHTTAKTLPSTYCKPGTALRGFIHINSSNIHYKPETARKSQYSNPDTLSPQPLLSTTQYRFSRSMQKDTQHTTRAAKLQTDVANDTNFTDGIPWKNPGSYRYRLLWLAFSLFWKPQPDSNRLTISILLFFEKQALTEQKITSVWLYLNTNFLLTKSESKIKL